MSTSSTNPVVADVAVIGGSFAGMSAALQLARACRTVVIIDLGRPRNAAADRAHGCLGWDGCAPGVLLQTARRQLVAYHGVRWIAEEAVSVAGSAKTQFEVAIASGAAVLAKRLILAHGVIDHLPELPGLQQRWGSTVLHCPYCHGYEVRNQRLGLLLATGQDAVGHARFLSEWGQITVFHRGDHGDGALDLLERELAHSGIALERSPLLAVSDDASADLADGRRVVLGALFVHPEARLASPIACHLGCKLEAAGCISTDSAKQTTVEGVFACGDAARFAGNIALAIGEGALAGVAAHRSLLGLLD